MLFSQAAEMQKIPQQSVNAQVCLVLDLLPRPIASFFRFQTCTTHLETKHQFAIFAMERTTFAFRPFSKQLKSTMDGLGSLVVEKFP